MNTRIIVNWFGRMPYKPGRHFLQIPGPTNVPDRILHAIGNPTIDHRGADAAELTLGMH